MAEKNLMSVFDFGEKIFHKKAQKDIRLNLRIVSAEYGLL